MVKRQLLPAGPDEEKRAGALLQADLYNELVEYAVRMDVDLSWVVRQAFREFVHTHRADLDLNPRQLALDLGLKAR